ncbi:acyl-CoA dehydrogenase NM domain-like protein [Rhizoclosmatium globosum]|uniref:Acyl-CoA dehydrogenase NM domain-like protein n=1 Tax=Rhizoclosmatium globosum TaxID=329046 RepID=A0A1Y2CJI9_9FUNG|nr:acyl-CoA dehydrogenase NM domain-like protein [Rhizoclosmatium globosum]|eukprot:ORY46485.1 acyl-CoA dehydrogenase NM domain-like protein [Rhizoclosmatium globosum]
MKRITPAELSKHNTVSDAWLSIDGLVFDVTDFLEGHPGGRRVMLPFLGKDATAEFRRFHNPKLRRAWLCRGFGCGFEFEGGVRGPSLDQGWKSPYYKESHHRVRAWARDLVDRELMPYIHEWDTAGEVPISVYRKMGELGLLSCMIGVFPWPDYAPNPPPAGVNPAEWDMFHELVVTDELNRIASVGINQFFWKELLIKPCLSGQKNIALGITEPYAGSDVANILTTATKTPDGKHYVLNGEKKWITTGNWAENGGISLILVDRTTPGFSSRPVPCQGCRGSGTAYLMMEDCKVPVENLIGKENQGFSYIMKNFNHERLSGTIATVRLARVCYEEAFVYAHKRRTFGKILFEHGVIRNKLGHMLRQIEATQAWVEFICYQLTQMSKEDALHKMGGPTALLKAQTTQVLEYCAREASQILGGVSYTKGGLGEKVERIYRDVRGLAIPGGSEEIMLDLGVRQAQKMSESFGAKL